MWLLSYSTAKFRDSMSILREASLADETFDLVLYLARLCMRVKVL
jgi:hypothetical protein